MKCSDCSFLGFTDEPSKRFEFSERMVQHGDHITLYLSSKERHFKCDIPKSPPDIEAQSQRQDGMAYNPQISSTVMPFPDFRQYNKRVNYNLWDDESSEASSDPELNRNPHNAPTIIPQHREAANKRTASPADPTTISNCQPIILPRANQSSSTSEKSSEPPNTIPDNPHSVRQGDWTSEMEQGTSIYIQNPIRRGTLATKYMSPRLESRIRHGLGQGTFEGNRVSSSARASYGNIYGMFSSNMDKSSYMSVLETPSRQYNSAHVETLDAENKPVTSSSHKTRVNKEDNDLPVHENRFQSSISGFAKTVVGTVPSMPATNPTRAAPRDPRSSTCSRLGKRKLSPQIRASQRLPQLQRSLHPKPAVPSSYPTPSETFPVKPSATLPPVSQKPQSINLFLLARTRRAYSSVSNTSTDRSVTPLNQEVSLQSGEGSSSTPKALPAKRPVSPAIRVAKVLHRKKPL
ncbi:hypothetical protein EYC80_006755 [Monilinia laxa]|uniref:Uncharacterized protein n=1 Tax=Monilinia laxa TaxID=61186 RepID=A0A5N6JZ28_MONLA|nr:hypothetical protein EYC80_006755 [Monilinia laxa]